MSSEARCENVRALDAELALGAVGGEERAAALEHLAACEECRRAVGELSHVADELLLLAPRAEPPEGFESRVLTQLHARGAPRRVRPRRTRLAMLAAASLAVAAAGAIALAVGPGGDGRSASEQSQRPAHTSRTEVRARLYGHGKVARGSAYGYQGSPSWLFITVDRLERPGRYRCEIVTAGGRRISLRSFRLDSGTRSWGVSMPVDLDEVAGVRLVPAAGGGSLRGKFQAD
jgi:hypothetical protein